MTQLQTKTSELDQLYIFKDKEKVLDFLTPALINILLDAPAHIRKHFPDAPLFLELYTDIEEPDWVQLALSIGTTLEADEARDKMEQLQDDWWLDAPDEGRQNMNIYLEFLDEV